MLFGLAHHNREFVDDFGRFSTVENTNGGRTNLINIPPITMDHLLRKLPFSKEYYDHLSLYYMIICWIMKTECHAYKTIRSYRSEISI